MSEDESVLLMLSKRQAGVSAEIRTGRLTDTLKQDMVSILRYYWLKRKTSTTVFWSWMMMSIISVPP